jgi:hypothetical protein
MAVKDTSTPPEIMTMRIPREKIPRIVCDFRMLVILS